jgi:hypothetical protein
MDNLIKFLLKAFIVIAAITIIYAALVYGLITLTIKMIGPQ